MARDRLSFSSTLAITVACGGLAAATPGMAQPADPAGLIDEQRLLDAEKDRGNWLHHHGNYAAHRFSPLTQITGPTSGPP